MMNKKIKKMKYILVAVIVLVLVGISCFLSYTKFGVVNSLSTGIALVRVVFTNTKYVEVQRYPKVIIANPDNARSNLIEYMNDKGFNEDKSGQMGAIMRFENDISAQFVSFSANAYFSEWRWHE